MSNRPQSEKAGFSDKGLILRTYKVRESDLLCTILTASRGKLTAVARGASRSRRRFAGGLQIFDHGVFSLTPPQHRFPDRRDSQEVFTLQDISQRESWPGLATNLDRFQTAALVLESADTLTHEGDPSGTALFEPLVGTLRELNHASSREYCANLASLFLLLCLRESGLDPLAAPNCPAKLRDWFDLAAVPTPIQQDSSPSELANYALVHLSGYLESSVGKQLKSLSRGY